MDKITSAFSFYHDRFGDLPPDIELPTRRSCGPRSCRWVSHAESAASVVTGNGATNSNNTEFNPTMEEEQKFFVQQEVAHSWETLTFEDALAAFESSDELPSLENFICILQKCRKKRSPKYARQVHMNVLNHGMEFHKVLGNHLVPMLVECGCMSEAQLVFNRLVYRNEHSWTSLIQGYNDSEEPENVISVLKRMQESGVRPSRHTYVALLKACAKLNNLELGHRLHAEVIKEHYEDDIFIGNTLVDMYAKCGSLVEARKVFDMLPVRDVVSWTALLAGYADNGFGLEALVCLQKMKSEDINLNDVTFICGLKACASIADLHKGQELHTEIVKEGYEDDPYIGNALVDMYAKCGLHLEAQFLFNDMSNQDEVSWNSLIAGYVENELGKDALNCFNEMKKARKSPNAVTYICILKACGIIGSLEKTKEIHKEIDQQGFGDDLLVCNALLDAYCQCGSITDAGNVFDNMPNRDVVSWTTLMVGFAENGLVETAVACLRKMRNEGIRPDAITYISLLKCCSNGVLIDAGREIHEDINNNKGGYKRIVAVGNSLINMYVKCGSLEDALEVFENMPAKNVVTWTTLLAGYAERGCSEKALKLLEQMKQDGVSPNEITFVCSLKACSTIKAIYMGWQIHYDVIVEGLEKDTFVANSLIDMYAKCGFLREAQETFNELKTKDIISWTSLIAGYADGGFMDDAQNCFDQMQIEGIWPETISWSSLLMGYAEKGLTEKAFQLYGRMIDQGLLPNKVSYLGILKSCVDMETGKRIHAQIRKSSTMENDLLNSLIDMYSRLGKMSYAQKCFDDTYTRDHVTWTTLMKGYMLQRESERVVQLFERMIQEGLQPDGLTFLTVLNACRFNKLVEKGQKLFEMMSIEYGISPTIEHKNCIADLLTEAGRIDEAVEIIL